MKMITRLNARIDSGSTMRTIGWYDVQHELPKLGVIFQSSCFTTGRYDYSQWNAGQYYSSIFVHTPVELPF
jgi:hypothetical protein